jgi:hypothetical protein
MNVKLKRLWLQHLNEKRCQVYALAVLAHGKISLAPSIEEKFNSRSASQKIRCILWNSKVHYSVTLQQPGTSPYLKAHEFSSHAHAQYFNIHFNIILLSTIVSQVVPYYRISN